MSPSPDQGMGKAPLYPVFLKLSGREVVVVGGGVVAGQKLPALLGAGAKVTVVALEVSAAVAAQGVRVVQRAFRAEDLDGAAFVVAAAPPQVNREVAAAAAARGLFVNAVDDGDSGSAYLGGVVRKDGVTLAISTEGEAPALAGLLREGFEALLPDGLAGWLSTASALRARQKAQGVPMPERRPQLLEALNALYASRAPAPGGGFVSLVGAGPGDPDLLTRKAVRRLAEADLVLYDALVSEEVLALAPRAHCFFVGKRARRKAVKQETINRLLVRAARRGQRVVRLKCGDPFVLGRGGEEALALVGAGIPFEVVPGVSSAVAAPALAGIPVTHRGLASGFAVISGHSSQTYERLVAALAPNALTLVVLMGRGERAQIAQRLLAQGWRQETPCALLLDASRPQAARWLGTLETLAQGAAFEESSDAPGTLVVGDVVSLAGALAPPAPGEKEEAPEVRSSDVHR